MAGHFYAEFYDLSDCDMLLFMIIGIQFVMAIKLNKNVKIKWKKLHNFIQFASLKNNDMIL